MAGDNYHPTDSHVLPALISRFHEAVHNNAATVTCWGSGSPLREFLHVDDLGEACVFALEQWQPCPEELKFMNVGTGVDLTIREVAEAVAKATGYVGEIIWDLSKPDGTPKSLDVSRFKKMGWQARIPFVGLRDTVKAFREANTLFIRITKKYIITVKNSPSLALKYLFTNSQGKKVRIHKPNF